jgi:hypothetical protein
VAGDSWWQLAVAAFLAVVFTQIGFLGHDTGHRQVFGTRRASYAAGILLGNLGIGLSYGWWVDKHNRHHAHANTEDAYPDIAVGALAFTSAQARASRGAARLVFRYQAYLFFPLLLGEAVSLHVASGQALSRRAARRRSWADHHPCRGLPRGGAPGALTVGAVVFMIVQQGLFGLYLGCSSAPNHKGMPVLDAADRSDFLRRQVLTSRNVRDGWLTDFPLGGLSYQIEHDLFASMPHPDAGVPGPAAVASAWSGPGQLQPRADARQEGEDFADGGFLGGGLGQREVRLDLEAVAAAVFLLDHVSGCGQVGDDAVRAALGDAQAGRDVAQPRAGVAGDAQQHPGVAGQETPARHR